MKDNYREIMGKIVVTEEMKKRISNNIREYNFEDKSSGKKRTFNFKKYLTLAASVLILVLGTFSLTNILKEESPPLLGDNPIESIVSIEDLSKKVGFKVEGLSSLPFKVDRIEYYSYEDNIAEVLYFGGNDQASFRMARGEEDISGDYSSYPKVEGIKLDKLEVSLSGNSEGYSRATWLQGGYSYSLRLDRPISKKDFIDILKSIE